MGDRRAGLAFPRLGVGLVAGALAIVAPAASAPTRASEPSVAGARRTAVVEAVEKAKGAVVNISSEKKAASSSRWPFSPEENQRPRVNGMGSGVIVDGRGYILTNHHVVDKVQGIQVQLLDGSAYPALVLQVDPVMDLALIKIEPASPLQAITIGTSSDLMLGESVIAIGNAFGYENTVSLGIIGALHRDLTLSDDQVYRNLIQTDAAINPGNSGGALINIEGELIGINVAVRAGAQGLGFALPVDEVKRAAAEMLSTRRIAATWHGVVAAETLRGGHRVLVAADVQRGGPGEAAGIRPGDELVQIAGMPVANALDVERAFLDARPGAPAQVVVRRGGAEVPLALDVRPLPRGASLASLEPGDPIWESLGLRTAPASTEDVANVNPKLRGGLLIQAVSPGSPAAAASLQRGDILVGMNVGERNWETIRPDHILHVLSQPEAVQTDSALLYVIRRNGLQQRRISLADPRVKNIIAQ
ncbi:trypsin-like peptidase domain-containing protein [Paludisphaera sp.]|uniref:trypsin-like peptidase domain-containing protein n=1 Tax=Paludisphaera sp. TaxID=2017432 RepID=UPI00301CC073